MNAAIVKLAPTAVVIGVGGFLAWPYVGSDAPHWDSAAFAAASTPTAKPTAASPGSAGGGAAPAGGSGAKGASTEIPFALLNPKLVPNPPRDPFSDPEALREAVRDLLRKKISDGLHYLADQVKPPAKPNVTTARGNSLGAKGKGAGGSLGRAGSAAADPLSGLTLNATYILGSKAAAVINGTSYNPGQALNLDDVAPASPLLLAEVRRHSVLLSQGGKEFELKYAELRSGPPVTLSEASANGKSAAKRGRGAKPGAGKKVNDSDPFDSVQKLMKDHDLFDSVQKLKDYDPFDN
jgi:hypothetical protein